MITADSIICITELIPHSQYTTIFLHSFLKKNPPKYTQLSSFCAFHCPRDSSHHISNLVSYMTSHLLNMPSFENSSLDIYDIIVSDMFLTFFFFLFQVCPQHWEVPRPGIKSELQLYLYHSWGNTGSLTHCTWDWIHTTTDKTLDP